MDSNIGDGSTVGSGNRRMRRASLVFHACTFFTMALPALHQVLPLTWLQFGSFMHILHVAALLALVWGVVVLGRDPYLKVLMAFGSRRDREATARRASGDDARRIVLDEFDFHLRGEAFRISYQMVATLIALAAVASFLLHAFTEIKINWNNVLMLTFPFGILWLLALPTTIVVWLSNPPEND